jgi:hypothetical protein
MEQRLILINPEGDAEPTTLQSEPTPLELPNTGYIASVVSLNDVAAQTESGDVRRLVQWINDSDHVGKIRFFAHGNQSGQVSMPTGSSNKDWDRVWPQDLVKWLCQNGLAQKDQGFLSDLGRKVARVVSQLKGLVTVCLHFCYAGKQTPEHGQPTLLRSAVDRVAQELTNANLRSIKVTGCADPVAIRPSNDVISREARIAANNVALVRRRLAGDRNPTWLSVAQSTTKDVLRVLPKKVVKQMEDAIPGLPLHEVSRLSWSALEIMFQELQGDVEQLVYDDMIGPYPKESLPGQWGQYLTLPDGTRKWNRLQGIQEKFERVS